MGAEWEVQSRGLEPQAMTEHAPDMLLFLSLSFLICGMGVGPAVSHCGVLMTLRALQKPRQCPRAGCALLQALSCWRPEEG